MPVLMRAPTKQTVESTAFGAQPSGLLTPHCYQATRPVQPLASAPPGPTHKQAEVQEHVQFCSALGGAAAGLPAGNELPRRGCE